jgi:DNA-binding transcriptional regulator YbjK
MPKIVDHDERRVELVDALWRVVERDGATAISIRNVAAEAGHSKSAIAHYFPSRLSLLTAAVTQLGDDVLRKVAALDLTDGRVETACAAIMAAIPDSRARRKHSEVWILLISERQTDPEVRKLLAQLDQRVSRGFTAALRTFQDSGLVDRSRDVEIEAIRLHAFVDGISLHTLHDPVGMSPKRIRVAVTAHLEELATPAPVLRVG